MRLKSGTLSTLDKEELSNFVDWLLRVRNGTKAFASIPNEINTSDTSKTYLLSRTLLLLFSL
jgi:hypothetical protein